MIQSITKEKMLQPFIHYSFFDSGISVDVQDGLLKSQYVGIKVDDYYKVLILHKAT